MLRGGSDLAGQSHDLPETEEMGAIVVGSSGDETADLDAALAWDGIEADEVHGDVLEDGEVVSGMAGAGAHLVVGKGHIHAPVQTVLDRPMLADGTGGTLGIREQAADVVAVLKRALALDGPFGLDDHEGLELRPLRRVVQAIELIEHETTAVLNAAVILLDALEESMRRLVRRGGLEQSKEVADRVGQRGLIVLDGEHVVGLAVANRLGNVRLCPHRVDRDDAPFERQRLQQHRNGHLFVGLLRRRHLAQH